MDNLQRIIRAVALLAMAGYITSLFFDAFGQWPTHTGIVISEITGAVFTLILFDLMKRKDL